MGNHRSQDWRQIVRQWHQALLHFFERWQYQEQSTEMNDPIWSSPFFISGGPVHTIKNDADNIIVTVALPGLEPTDITLALEKNRLLIRGKTKRIPQGDDHVPHYTELNARTRIRSAVLPCAVDLDQATISRQKGLLQITLPKRSSVFARQVNGDGRPPLRHCRTA
jgi:HSP20 family molecular chaperone IbpA